MGDKKEVEEEMRGYRFMAQISLINSLLLIAYFIAGLLLGLYYASPLLESFSLLLIIPVIIYIVVLRSKAVQIFLEVIR